MTTSLITACTRCGSEEAFVMVASPRALAGKRFCSYVCLEAHMAGQGSTAPRPIASARTEARQQERAFLEEIRTQARALGWETYHAFDSRKSEPGWPDLVLVHRRFKMVIFAELKTATGRVSNEQQRWMWALEAIAAEAPGVVYAEVWRPADRARINRLLAGEGEES